MKIKWLLFFLFFLSFFNLSAQSKNVTDNNHNLSKKGLNKIELKRAVDDYLKLTKSNIYIEIRENMLLINKKLKGIDLPSQEIINSIKASYDNKNTNDNDRINLVKEIIKKHLLINIQKTDFNSIDEATSLITNNILLYVEMYNNNIQLYKLIGRANKEQVKQILAPDRINPYDLIYRYSKH